MNIETKLANTVVQAAASYTVLASGHWCQWLRQMANVDEKTSYQKTMSCRTAVATIQSRSQAQADSPGTKADADSLLFLYYEHPKTLKKRALLQLFRACGELAKDSPSTTSHSGLALWTKHELAWSLIPSSLISTWSSLKQYSSIHSSIHLMLQAGSYG